MDSLTERVPGAVFEVTNTPGAGFLEKVYQRALFRELGLRGIRACRRSFIYRGFPIWGPLETTVVAEQILAGLSIHLLNTYTSDAVALPWETTLKVGDRVSATM